MKLKLTFVWMVLGALHAAAQVDSAAHKLDFRASLGIINDTTVYSGLQAPTPQVLNELLVEPSLSIHQGERWKLASSLVGEMETYGGTGTRLRVRETYAGVSAGDFDLTAGRKLVRWGTGYAFTPAGVLDPPRIPTNPTDRLNLNEGRDMVKLDYVHGIHALALAWSPVFLEKAQPNLRDTTALRYNVLVNGWDTSAIIGYDRGGDAFGGATFTRVFGQAFELHSEFLWRQLGAMVIGGKYTTPQGINITAELYTPPNTAYYRIQGELPNGARPYYSYWSIGKNRLRELPGWKEWDANASMVSNLKDNSFTAIFDANRRIGNRFSAYLHAELPSGSSTSEYGQTPYTAATSLGVRFQL